LFRVGGFTRGRSIFVEAAWLLVDALFIRSYLPGSKLRISILRLFGATIGNGVRIKPRVRIKFPWRLSVGAHVWIGEDVWIDNLASVAIGTQSCVSQGAYICTGSHDWESPFMDLVAKPVTIGVGAWVCARAVVGPGVRVGDGAILTLGSVAYKDLEDWTIYSGIPAVPIKKRTLRN
jgi:putative colanic acid biosynthesis acetyltransferase WcaF